MSASSRVIGERVSRFIDLDSIPFTLPGSRLLVQKLGDGVQIRRAEYERDLNECVVVSALRVFGEDGERVPITEVRPDRITFGTAGVTLTFDGTDALSLAGEREPWSATVTIPGSAMPTEFTSSGADGLTIASGTSLETVLTPSSRHEAALASTQEVWDQWFAKTPEVREDLAEMTALCWWVLGANIVTLPHLNARVVVPSKIGYVGLWQWDAYFIASGLRHGDPELAREQLDLAFRFPSVVGQLPDVVHDEGLIASSDDLPQADQERLRRAGSAISDPSSPVPLTKPPLAAWALSRLTGFVEDPTWFSSAWQKVAHSQEWWFTHSDLDGDGMPEYGHPYSSGLDDSPVFDAELPVASPDLAAYLIVQDDLLAAHAIKMGDADAARRYSERSERTLAQLETMWDDRSGYFRSHGSGTPADAETCVSLLPLLTGKLSPQHVSAILDALDDPERFASVWPVPTVARRDPAFSEERMWRGPVWVNVNALLAEGLAASGYPERGRTLAEQTLRMVIHGGGPHEYFTPSTGEKAPSATTAFGWSAALFVDLAVQVSR